MLEFDFSPFPELHTSRMLLRQMNSGDAHMMWIMRSSEEVMKYLEKPRAQNLEDAMEIIQKTNDSLLKNEGIAWAMCLHEAPAMIGTIGYWRSNPAHHRAEVGYLLHPDYWNKGLVAEAMIAVLRYGFEVMGLHSVEAHINPRNEPSSKVLARAGFVREALFRENYYFNGKFSDTAVYSLLAKDFRD